jgi:hypothetical protein
LFLPEEVRAAGVIVINSAVLAAVAFVHRKHIRPRPL